MSNLNILVIMNLTALAVNIAGSLATLRQSKHWLVRMDFATRCLHDATIARVEAFRLFGTMMQSPDTADRWQIAIYRMLEDDHVADRTKDALVGHLRELGLDIEAVK